MSHTPVKSSASEVIAPVFHVSLGRKVLQSSALQFGGRLMFRGLKFIRTIVVAQLLFPHDVGLFVLASLCLGFADIFVQTGFQSALVEREVLERRHLDGAWTVHVLKGLLLASVAFFLAPHLSIFFGEPELTEVLRALSIILALDGFANIGTVLLQKDFQFGKKLAYDFSYIITEIIAVIIAVQFFQNVWALVIGTLASQVASTFFSYVFQPYRPRFTFDLSGARELFHFSKWITFAGILTFFVSKGDGIVISKFLEVADLGYYQLAFSLAMLPALEIVRALGSVFFPFFARMKEKPKELRDVFVRISRMVLLVVAPIIAGLYAVSESMIATLYGEKWLPIVPVFGVLVIYGSIKSIEYFLTPIFLGTGNSKILMYGTIIYGAVMSATIVPLSIHYGIIGTAWSLVLSICTATIYLVMKFYSIVSISLKQTISIITVPLFASFFMYFTVLLFQIHVLNMIIFSILIGIVTYLLIVYFLDRYSGNNIRTSFLWIRKNLRSSR